MLTGSYSCLLGLHGSCSSAQLPVELSESMLQNIFLNLPPQTVQCYIFTTSQKVCVLTMSGNQNFFVFRII